MLALVVQPIVPVDRPNAGKSNSQTQPVRSKSGYSNSRPRGLYRTRGQALRMPWITQLPGMVAEAGEVMRGNVLDPHHVISCFA